MRIDKFLKVSRIIIRRTVAKKACDGGRVKINDKTAKAGDEVNIGDVIEVSFGDSTRKYEVLDVKDQVGKKDAQNLFRVLE